MDSIMVIQWLTFAVMILIQAVAAGVIISAIRVTLATHGEEIKFLRDWRHSLAPKEMLIDDHVEQLKDHEQRIRVVEKERGTFDIDDCPLSKDCPLRRQPVRA